MKIINPPITLIFLGLQGSGKGTQAYELMKKYKFNYIEMGALLRQIVKKKKGSKEVLKLVPQGKLVPTRVTAKLIKNEIRKITQNNSLILDGFPRALSQAQALNKILKETDRDKNYSAVYFKISKKTGLKRLFNRWVCAKCGMIFSGSQAKCVRCGGKVEKRFDETPEIIKNRFKFVSKYIENLRSYYKKKGKLVEIDAERKIQEIHRDVIKKLGL